MKKIILASIRKNAGKTSAAVGLMKASGKKFGYLKPIGDRLNYKKKRLWDYDAAFMTSVFDIEGGPESMSIGFEHAKLRYIYDEKSTRERIIEKAEEQSAGNDILIVEAGADLTYGASVHLDAISLSNYLAADIVLVVSGDDYAILDEIRFIKKYLDADAAGRFEGVIINKVQDVEDFRQSHAADVAAMGVDVLGLIPFMPELTYVSAGYYAERLFARVIAGENGLDKIVKNIFVGAMSAASASMNPAFEKENKLIITTGDRGDMIVDAMESNVSCVILTDNILPHANIVSRAAAAAVPLLLVPWDTFYTTTQIDRVEPLLSKNDTGKIDLIAQLVRDNVDLNKIFGE